MSHHKNEHIVCPNCGFSASHNYCAQCGQETHLHKETFIGLVVHFVAHYFHYDSKFWQTLKVLFSKPGKLTVDYWQGKRNRYIPPISLYIFVSAVFFLCFFSTVGSKSKLEEVTHVSADDSLRFVRERDSMMQVKVISPDSVKMIQRKLALNKRLHEDGLMQELLERAAKAFPKLFFFMIPLMGAVLKLLYMKRKDVYFVRHAVFSLHIHAFVMVMLLLTLYELPDVNLKWYEYIISFVQELASWAILVYLVVAIHNVYRSGWVRSILYGVVISLSYIIFALVVFIAYFGIIVAQSI